MKTLFFMSSLFLSAITFIQAQSIIPNGDFENWHAVPNTYGAEDPDHWESNNKTQDTIEGYGISKSTDAYSGQYALKVSPIKKNLHDYSYSIIRLGKLNMDSLYVCAGDSIGFMPFAVTGYYKFITENTGKTEPIISVNLSTVECIMTNDLPSAFGDFEPEETDYYRPFAIPLEKIWATLPFSPFIFIDIVCSSIDTIGTGEYLLIDNLDVMGELVSSKELLPLAQRVAIFPNPAQNSFSIDIPKGIDITQIELVDMQGRILKNIPQNSTNIIDISNLESGNYLIKIRTPEGVFAKKLQKN